MEEKRSKKQGQPQALHRHVSTGAGGTGLGQAPSSQGPAGAEERTGPGMGPLPFAPWHLCCTDTTNKVCPAELCAFLCLYHTITPGTLIPQLGSFPGPP